MRRSGENKNYLERNVSDIPEDSVQHRAKSFGLYIGRTLVVPAIKVMNMQPLWAAPLLPSNSRWVSFDCASIPL